MKYLYVLSIAVFVLLLNLPTRAQSTAPANPYNLPDGLYTEVTTPRGVIVGELFYKHVPMTVANYVGLAEGTLGPRKGSNFYENNTFFRVVPNFVIQGGSGAPGANGRGPGYSFPDEIVPGLRHDSVGVIQMANSGPDTNGSQWCMMTCVVNRLNYNHTVFGHVIRGIEILPQIQQGDSMAIRILRIGADAKAFKADEAAFKALVDKAKKYEGPRQPGPDAWFDDPDKILPTDIPRAQDFTRKLGNFQRFTGIRIIGRMYAKTPADAQGEKLDTFMKSLADKLKVGDQGAVAVYFQDTDQWHLLISPGSQASFIAGPRKVDGTKDPAPADKTLDQAIKEFLAAAKEEVPSLIAVAVKAGSTPTTEGQKIKFQVDAVLDNLIFRLEPAAPK